MTVGGLVTGISKKLTHAGATMAFVNIEDLTGHMEIIVFPRLFTESMELLKPDTVLLFRGAIEVKEQAVTLLCNAVLPLPAGPLYATSPVGSPRRHGFPCSEAAQPGQQLAGEPLLGGGDPLPQSVVYALHVRVQTRAQLVAVEEIALAHLGDRRLVLHIVNGQEHLRSCRTRVTNGTEIEQALAEIVGTTNIWTTPDTLEAAAS